MCVLLGVFKISILSTDAKTLIMQDMSIEDQPVLYSIRFQTCMHVSAILTISAETNCLTSASLISHHLPVLSSKTNAV